MCGNGEGKGLARIGRCGGVVACLEKGWQQDLIQQAAYEYQVGIETKKRIVVGLNQFADDTSTAVPVLKIDPKIESQQVARLAKFRSTRKADATAQTLTSLTKAAKEDQNLLPHIFNAVKAHATLGEIIGTLTDVYGRYRP